LETEFVTHFQRSFLLWSSRKTILCTALR